jgi:hypothetical protein
VKPKDPIEQEEAGIDNPTGDEAATPRSLGGVVRPERASNPNSDDEIEWEEDYDTPLSPWDDGVAVEELTIAWKELPIAVRKSAEAFFQTTKGLTCLRLQRGDRPAFIVEMGDTLARERDSPQISLTLAPSGMLIEVARMVTGPADLPTLVQEALVKHYNNVQFEGGEEVTMHFYELGYSLAGETRMVQIDSSGVILSDEAL